MNRRAMAAILCGLLVAGCSAQLTPQQGDVLIRAQAPTAEPETGPTRVGPTALDEHVDFTLSLNLRDQRGLDTFLAGLNDPTSSHYQRFLSAADFGERFGLSKKTVDRVVGWLESAGLEAASVPQRTSIAVSGTVAAVNAAFGVTLIDWTRSDGERYHEPDDAPAVPSDLR